jgi:hypothetical protein
LELETVERVERKESHSGNDNASELLRQTVSNACYIHDTIAARKQKRDPEYNRVNTEQQNEG